MRGLEGSPFTASVVAFVFAGCFSGGAAKAADLGGDCCSDLEESVAELEATTVRKGNKKVTVTLYGRVNRIVNFWDDGVESNTYTLNSSYSPTRWGFRGDAKIGARGQLATILRWKTTGTSRNLSISSMTIPPMAQ